MFTMKCLGSFLWKCQLRITAMWIGLGRLRTQNSPVAPSSAVCSSGGLVSFFARTHAVREKHLELVNTQRCVCVCVCVCVCACVCVCVCVYIDMVSQDNTVQTAIMFSVTNSRYCKRNCEVYELFFESGLDRVWGNWIKLFMKIRKFQSYFLT